MRHQSAAAADTGVQFLAVAVTIAYLFKARTSAKVALIFRMLRLITTQNGAPDLNSGEC